MIKALSVFALAASSILIPAPAQAWDVCNNEGSIKVCAYGGERFDVLRVEIDRDIENMVVQCKEGTWGYSSYGDLSESDATTIAESYCEGRGSYSHSGVDI